MSGRFESILLSLGKMHCNRESLMWGVNTVLDVLILC